MQSALNSAQSYTNRFSHFRYKIFLLQVKGQKNQYLGNNCSTVWKSSIIRKIWQKWKICLCNFVQNYIQILKLHFFVLPLIVFNFYSFWYIKRKTSKNMKIVIFTKNILTIKICSWTKCILFFYSTYAAQISLRPAHK